MKKTRFIAIRNQADSSTLELYFLDVIADTYDYWSGATYSKMQEIVDKVNYYQPSKIRCIIDSIGGDAQLGLSIYNFLKHTSAKVEVEIIGLAGSIASVVAMAANKGKLSIAKNAFMMIHKAEGVMGGTSEELREGADLIDKYDAQIASIYSQRTGRPVDEITALYAADDYWMTGDEAVAQGFADFTFNEVENISIAARLKDENIPSQIRAQLNPETSFFQTQIDDMKKFFQPIMDAIKGIKPAEGQVITNQIAEAIQVPFEKLGDEIETTITNKVGDVVKSEAFTTAITNAVSEATKPLTDRIATLEATNKDLETEITNIKGGPTNSQEQKPVVEPVGSFK